MRYLTLILLFVASLGLLCSQTPRETDHFNYIVQLYDTSAHPEALLEIESFRSQYPESIYGILTDYLVASITFNAGDYQRCLSLYPPLLREDLHPDLLGDVYLNYAICLYHLGKYSDSIARLQELSSALDIPYYNLQAQLWKARAYVAQGFNLSAEYEFRQVLDQGMPEAKPEYFSTLLALEKETEAKAILDSLALDDPARQECQHLWLEYLLNHGRGEDFDLDLYNLPDNAFSDAIRLLAIRRFYETERYEAVSAALDSLDQISDQSLYYRALLLKQEGDIQKADSLLKVIVLSGAPNLRLFAYLQRLRILYDSDPGSAIQQLQNYIAQSKHAQIRGEQNHQLAWFLYGQRRYAESILQAVTARNYELQPVFADRNEDLIAQAYYQMGEYRLSGETYNRYLNLYPQGAFRDKALYHIGLIAFLQLDFPLARNSFISLLELHPVSLYADEARFYLAEMRFFGGEYAKATELYTSVRMTTANSRPVVLRLAQCYYYQDRYAEALSVLDSIDPEEMDFDSTVLLAGVYFNQKDYASALEQYEKAERMALSQPQQTEARSYRAYTLYYQRRFTEASQLFYELSRDSLNADIYLYQAGRSAAQGRDYQRALALYNDFLELYPESGLYLRVLTSIANAEFNLGNFVQSFEQWLNILRRFTAVTNISAGDEALLKEIFNGIEVCAKRMDDPRQIAELAEMMENFNSAYIRFELEYIIVKLYADAGLWTDLLNEAETLRHSLDEEKRGEVELLMLESLIRLNQYERADSLASDLYTGSQNPRALLKWAELAILTSRPELAMERYLLAWHQYGDALTPPDSTAVGVQDENAEPPSAIDKATLWLAMLDLSVQTSFMRFEELWGLEPSLSESYPQARLHRIKYLIAIGNFGEALKLADSILDVESNPYYRAEAETQIGLIAFQQMDYDNALRTFRKLRLIHREFPDILLTANYHYILCLIHTGAIQEAMLSLQEARGTLSDEQLRRINGLLGRDE